MHDEIHNVYGLTWDKVVKEQFEKRNPNRRVFQMTRRVTYMVAPSRLPPL